MPEIEYIFETTDPFGSQIAMPRATWEEHILVGHPEMEEYLIRIQETIEEPNIILRKETVRTQIYESLTPWKQYVNVIVGMNETYEVGKVRTAYLSGTIMKGDLIYIKK